jgi:tRNA nucleotidyltransferase/poly(A) polymerase
MQRKRIRTLGRSNLLADPLRMIRAYRFASEIDGFIEERTRHLIKTLHDRIKKISSERITLEFFHLLNSEQSAECLKIALDDGLLGSILSFPLGQLEENIRAVSDLEKENFNILPRGIKVSLNKIFSQNLTHKGLLCLEALLCDHVPLREGDHRLTMSQAIHKRLVLTTKGLKDLKSGRQVSKGRIFDAFMRSKEASIDVLIIGGRHGLFGEYKRFRKLWKNGYLTAREIAAISGISSGPELGDIISSLRRAEFEREVKSRAEAVQFVNKYSVQ